MNEASTSYSGNDQCVQSETTVDCSCDEEIHNAPDLLEVKSIGDVITKPNNLSTFGNIHVEESNNVRIGNCNSYNGPVTIQQIFNSHRGSRRIFPAVPVAPENLFSLENNAESSDLAVSKENPKRNLKLCALISAAITIPSLILSAALIYVVVVWKISSNHTNHSVSKCSATKPAYTSSTFLNSTTSTGSDSFLPLVSRSEWNATNYDYDRENLERPEFVIISHTKYYLSCFSKSECASFVRNLQKIDREKFHDIKYNFYVGGDGNIYEGRGWNIVGNPASHPDYQRKSLGVAFLGDYNKEKPTQRQLEAAKKLLKFGLENNKIANDFKLLGRYQVDVGKTDSPGFYVSKIIKSWQHWATINI